MTDEPIRVLLAEDDAAIAEPLARALNREGYAADWVTTGPEAVDRGVTGDYGLVILDLGLPGLDGLEVCRRIRATAVPTAILMLTARTAEVDFVVGLDAGADDYVGKPFRLGELLARVRALLRRNPTPPVPASGITVDVAARRVWLDGDEVMLTNREFDLLQCLTERAGQVVSRREILASVWGSTELSSSKTLDMHISWLRRKLGDDDPDRRHIVTVRGVGFRFDP